MARFASVLTLPLGALLVAGCSAPPEGFEPDYWAGPHGSWQEVYRDDFDGPVTSPANATAWNERVVPAPFNGEQEYYTNRPSNVMLDGTGNLVLTALSEHFVDAAGVTSAQPYTSARLDTLGLVQPQYGRIEARIQVPVGRGLWPAFWMMGSNIDTVGWPDCGEIDIFELGGSTPTTITGSLHGTGFKDGSKTHDSFTLGSGSFADGFHVYALEWTADGMRWLVDEQPYSWRTPQGLANLNLHWIFDQPMFILLNLAVGGIYDGDPDATTPLPAHMLVDYVQVSKLIPN